jgi:hypothetical protein
MSWKQTLKGVTVVATLLCLLTPLSVFASQSHSTNYQVNEIFFGGGGALNDCSTHYCAKESIGETAVGTTSSTNY